MSSSYDPTILGERFGVDRAPTALARTASVAPIAFTRLRSDAGFMRARDVPFERAYAFHVSLKPTQADLWIDGKHRMTTLGPQDKVFAFDLASNPVSEFHAPFDNLRFYISQLSLEELAFDRGIRGAIVLRPPLGVEDRVMQGLAMALMDGVERADERSALFIDHIGLAFHAHVTATYAEHRPFSPPARDQLAPWQLRRATDFMIDRLSGDPTIAELAQECGLSATYFARAFRQTAGVSPHQWLIRRRIERARELLLDGELGLAEIAVVCGFVDQSHLTRMFARIVGESPGRWRRRHR